MRKIKLISCSIFVLTPLFTSTACEEANQVPSTIETNYHNELSLTNLRRVYSGVYVKDFGAKADANYYNPRDGKYYKYSDFSVPATDDTEAINTAIKYASSKDIKDVYMPEGNFLINPVGTRVSHDFEYAVNGGIQLESNINLMMHGNTKLLMNTAYEPGYSMITIDKKENVKVLGGILIGDINSHPSDTHTYCHGITIAHASQNVLIANTEVRNMEDDGIMIADYLEHLSDAKKTSGIEIRNVKSHNNGRQGLTISTGSDMKIVDSEFSNQRKHSPMSGIDIELESFDHRGVRNIQIIGNTFSNNKYSGIVISDSFNDRPNTMSENIMINENTITNSRFGVISPGKVTKLDISNNKIDMQHLAKEFTVAIGSTSKASKEVTIKNNEITSSDPRNKSIGIMNISPETDITGNIIQGQKEALWLNGNEGRVYNNRVKK